MTVTFQKKPISISDKDCMHELDGMTLDSTANFLIQNNHLERKKKAEVTKG